jgi:transcription factor S
MLFCPKCKGLLAPKKEDPRKIVCNGCGYNPRQQKVIKIGEKAEVSKKLEIIDKTMETLPKTDATCPKCEHNKAYYWSAQTRAADEAETMFFRCAKCSNQWRSY